MESKLEAVAICRHQLTDGSWVYSVVINRVHIECTDEQAAIRVHAALTGSDVILIDADVHHTEMRQGYSVLADHTY